MKWRIDMGDPSSRIALAICACGWRGLATSRDAALARLTAHETHQHPDDHQVRDARRQRRGRRATSTKCHTP
ncbi:hypothetical protein [Actinomyces provencensis]|uniref:hypothetical protein n=1 Tax=Actinomyces provencensis TaxID=1720198 RepID=UPI00096A7033|nr:hypothetical protein [Actinomyces provencensis]